MVLSCLSLERFCHSWRWRKQKCLSLQVGTWMKSVPGHSAMFIPGMHSLTHVWLTPVSSHNETSLSPVNFTFLSLFLLGSDKTVCREPIHSVFHYVLDQNADGVLDDAELADIYEIATEPCIKEFFKNCAKGRETFTEAEFCSCFSTAGKEGLFMFQNCLKVKWCFVGITCRW